VGLLELAPDGDRDRNVAGTDVPRYRVSADAVLSRYAAISSERAT
jgi:hypothetical protein